MSTETAPQEKKRTKPYGNWVVVAMFGFGILATSFLWVFWNMHVGPFVPLQRLLEAEFADSKPRVEGGQKKMRESYPKILRVTMKVDFDPSIESEKKDLFVAKVERFIIDEFNKTVDEFKLSDFEKFELHLFLPQPEDEVKTWWYEVSVKEFVRKYQSAS